MNWYNWFAMGGYGTYVWTAYGITLLAFALNVIVSLRERRRVKKMIRHLIRHES